jgi:hypothetical protein
MLKDNTLLFYTQETPLVWTELHLLPQFMTKEVELGYCVLAEFCLRFGYHTLNLPALIIFLIVVCLGKLNLQKL